MPMQQRRDFVKQTGLAAIGVTGLTGMAGCIGGDGGGSDTLNLRYIVPYGNYNSLLDIPEVQDELDNVGEEYEVNIGQDTSTPDSIAGMARGDVDISLASTPSYGSAVAEEAVEGGIKAVSMELWEAAPPDLGTSSSIWTRENSDIEEPADLDGADVSVNALGTVIEVPYHKAKQVYDIDSVNFVEFPFPATPEAISDGRVDAGFLPAEFEGMAQQAGLVPVLTNRDMWEEAVPWAFNIAPQRALDEKEDLLQAWGEDFANLMEMMDNPSDEIIQAISDKFDIPVPALEFYYRENNYYREPVMDIDAMNEAMDELVQFGMLSESRDYSEYMTNEFVE